MRIISRETIRRVNEMANKERTAGVVKNHRYAQITINTIFGPKTINVSREQIRNAAKGKQERME